MVVVVPSPIDPQRRSPNLRPSHPSQLITITTYGPSHSMPSDAPLSNASTTALLDVANVPIRGIQDHALIGNLRTAALVSVDGSIESMCLPYFDSPSVFARIIDANKGGHFSISPTWNFKPKQAYAPNSNVLVTKFLSEEGVVVLTDLLVPKGASEGSQRKSFLPWLIRKVESIRGTVPIRMECAPAFNYCRDKHDTTVGHWSDDRLMSSSSTTTRSLPRANTSRKASSPPPHSPWIFDTSPGRLTNAPPKRRLSISK